MSILKIARLGHPVLYQKAAPVKNISDPSIKKLIHDMIVTMLDAKGIGLSAPQVHISKQIIIFNEFKVNDNKDNQIDVTQDNQINITALINPKISKISDDTENRWEGCLSIPGMLGLVKRYSKISCEGFDMNGNIIQQKAEGLRARVIQHEYDHLMGIVYTHRLVDKKAYGYADEIEEYWKENHEQK